VPGALASPRRDVRFGEPVTEAVGRVARDELGLSVTAGVLLGYIEYPSHYNHGLDSPVGLAFRAHPAMTEMPDEHDLPSECAWFTTLPDNMHDEQRHFLALHLDVVSRVPAAEPRGTRRSSATSSAGLRG
jgi:hypothetical protein